MGTLTKQNERQKNANNNFNKTAINIIIWCTKKRFLTILLFLDEAQSNIKIMNEMIKNRKKTKIHGSLIFACD